MIDVVSPEEVNRLAGVRSPHCVSLHLPTHRTGPGAAQDQIRLRNLSSEANDELVALGLRSPEAAELLGPVGRLVDDAEFWANAAEGLSIFVGPGTIERFRLPAPVEELAVVSDRFLLSPLLPFVTGDGGFYVLALAENEVRLLLSNRDGVDQVDDDQLPASLAEALAHDDRESQLQNRGAGRSGPGNVSAAFHGHGVANDFDEVDRGRFLRAVDAGLHGAVQDHSLPVVLAGTEEIVSQFRNLSRYRNIVDGHVGGNPEQRSAEELGQEASAVLPPDDPDEPPQGWGDAVDRIDDVLVAATSGRVARLLLAAGEHRWGRFDATGPTVEQRQQREPGDIDLLDLAAIETMGHGGVVDVVDASEMPIDGPVGAILRF